MSRNEAIFRRYEKLTKEAKKIGRKSKERPVSCARCSFWRPEFKYRNCQFSSCPFGAEKDVFRKKAAQAGRVLLKEVVMMLV